MSLQIFLKLPPQAMATYVPHDYMYEHLFQAKYLN